MSMESGCCSLGSSAADLDPYVFGSVGDPDPEPDQIPKDPHVFGPPGSGSISQRYGPGSGSFLFLIKVLSRLN